MTLEEWLEPLRQETLTMPNGSQWRRVIDEVYRLNRTVERQLDVIKDAQLIMLEKLGIHLIPMNDGNSRWMGTGAFLEP